MSQKGWRTDGGVGMSRYVWEVRTVGGDVDSVNAAITLAIGLLRSGSTVPGLDNDEVEPWAEDVSWVQVSDTVSHAGATSTLVDIECYDSSDVAAILSGGFDEVVLDGLMNIRDVTQATHSDRIRRNA